MKPAQPNIHDDLRSTLEQSLELKACLEHMCAEHNPSNGFKALNRLNLMEKKVGTLKASLGFKDPRHRLTPSSPLHLIETQRQSQSPSPPSVRHEGKNKLLKSLRDGNSRLLAMKAGRSIACVEEAYEPNILKIIRDIPFEPKEDQSFRSNSTNLPFVSLKSGRIEKPLALPTFEEYIESSTLGMNASVDRAMKSIQRTQEHIISFKKKIETVKQSMEGRRRMSRISAAQSFEFSLGRKRGVSEDKTGVVRTDLYRRTTETVDRLEKLHLVTVPATKPVKVRHRSEAVQKYVSNVASEENKLKRIVESILEERPVAIKRKLRLLSKDIDLLVGSAISKMLENAREIAEQERWDKRRLNLKQAEIYQNLLDGMRQRKSPIWTELAVVEIIRRVLENGEIISHESIQLIREVLGSKSSQVEEVLELLVVLIEEFNRQT